MNVTTQLRCPKCGEASSDAEFCSECGAPIAVAMPVSPPPPAAAPQGAGDAATVCPDCGQTRPGPLARYCDTCRYDFVAGHSFSASRPPPPEVRPPDPPVANTHPAETLPPEAPPAAAAAEAMLRWDLIVSVDPSLRKPEDPDPTDLRERIFPLDLADCLIGRRSDKDDIHPEIPIGDPGISRRHARLIRQPDGGVAVLDLGSMNGTRLNGVAVEANILTPFPRSECVTMGCWTRLSLRPR